MFQQVNLHGDIMQEITGKKYGKENNIPQNNYLLMQIQNL